jgi:hypothetical protein
VESGRVKLSIVLQCVTNDLQNNAVLNGSEKVSNPRSELDISECKMINFDVDLTCSMVMLMTKICLAQKQTFCTTERHTSIL